MVQFVFVCSYDTNALAKQIVEACFASAHRFYISSESEEKYAPIKRHLKVKNSPKHICQWMNFFNEGMVTFWIMN